MATVKDVMLGAFDRLFDRAARRLRIECTEDEKADAKRQFGERFEVLLERLGELQVHEVPDEVLNGMEGAIDQIRPSEIVGFLASIPLAHKGQEIMRGLAFRAAEQRLLEHLITQADESYGGN